MTSYLELGAKQAQVVLEMAEKVRATDDGDEIEWALTLGLDPIFPSPETAQRRIEIVNSMTRSFNARMDTFFIRTGLLSTPNFVFRDSCEELCEALARNPATPPAILFSIACRWTSAVSEHPLLPVFIDQGDEHLMVAIRAFYDDLAKHFETYKVLNFEGPCASEELVRFFNESISDFWGAPPGHPGIPMWKSTRKAGGPPTQKDIRAWSKKLTSWSEDETSSYPFMTSSRQHHQWPYVTDWIGSYLCKRSDQLYDPYDLAFYKAIVVPRFFQGHLSWSFSDAVSLVRFLQQVGQINGRPLGPHLLSHVLDIA